MAQQAKTLEDHARQVWMLPSIEDKKLIMLDMVNNFDYKGKAAQYEAKIKEMTSAKKLDELAANLTLWGSGLRVI